VKLSREGFEIAAAHAEFAALIQVPRYYTGRLKVYVTRVTRRGTLSLARPCEHCMKMLKDRGVKDRDIVYTSIEGNWVTEALIH